MKRVTGPISERLPDWLCDIEQEWNLTSHETVSREDAARELREEAARRQSRDERGTTAPSQLARLLEALGLDRRRGSGPDPDSMSDAA